MKYEIKGTRSVLVDYHDMGGRPQYLELVEWGNGEGFTAAWGALESGGDQLASISHDTMAALDLAARLLNGHEGEGLE